MRVEVYEEKPTEEPEKVLRLRLEAQSNRVCVIAVDEHGNRIPGGYLVSFEEDGSLWRYPCVGSRVGVKHDSDGRIVLT